jgi:hypothetical protein
MSTQADTLSGCSKKLTSSFYRYFVAGSAQ